VEKYKKIKSSVTAVYKNIHIVLPLEGVADIEKEKAKIDSRMAKLESEISAKKKTLGNKEFLKKAPAQIVEQEKSKLKDLSDTLEKLKGVKDGFA
jgi:valyl-tRNA synthetase